MRLELNTFSFYGSYMGLLVENQHLFLRSLHGDSKANMNSLELIPLYHQQVVTDFTTKMTATSVTISTKFGQLNLTFGDKDTLVFESNTQLGLKICSQPKFNFEYSYQLGSAEQPYYIINSYKNLTKYLVYTLAGTDQLSQELQVDTTGSNSTAHNRSDILVQPNAAGKMVVAIQEIQHNMANPHWELPEFETLVAQNKQKMADFITTSQLTKCPQKFKSIYQDAYYILWSDTVAPTGLLHYPSVYASNNHFPGVWTWDHCFMALALMRTHPDLAWAQMATVFDYQDAVGQLPGSISDSTIRWNFSKPPIHGLIFAEMLRVMSLTTAQKQQIYRWISKQVNYLVTYRDTNHDGIVEYLHGNDSGMDNSTVFKHQVVVDSPDLTAYLIMDYDLLAKLATELQLTTANHWQQQAKALSQRLVTTFFDKESLPFARETQTKQAIQSQSLLPLMSLTANRYLPTALNQAMVKQLKTHFMTTYGLATEALASPDYHADSYWRGAVWAPSTILIYLALEQLGETTLANQLKQGLCHMIRQSGFAENFDAKTGQGLRDRSFSWTASALIYLLEVV
ncbi:trehalase family glycosidase [Lactiplantibacillus sp. WILCCON 0030]|uniref:Trehalase family glycosidase n=1 Tax=Lactiplantibacillus brownii TaxID=3069269 RepID=A0ABU1A766_9LACO|nr:trehalase family glycosidase [Lactiplantibacillus brownii]MDQ7936773.1 trehalase family glycosidase [Lactiplantibacillus brownii]